MAKIKKARPTRPRADHIRKKGGSSGLRQPTQLNRRSSRLTLKSQPVAKQERVTIPALIKQGKPAPPPVSEEKPCQSAGEIDKFQRAAHGAGTSRRQTHAGRGAYDRSGEAGSPAPMPKDSLVASSGQDDDASLHPKGKEQVREEAEKHGEDVPKVKREHSNTTPVVIKVPPKVH